MILKPQSIVLLLPDKWFLFLYFVSKDEEMWRKTMKEAEDGKGFLGAFPQGEIYGQVQPLI